MTEVTLQMKVAERVTELAPTILDQAVDVLAQKEIARAVDIVTQGINKLDELSKELKKIDKPDVNNYDGDGNLIGESWTKGRLDQRKKLIDRIAKLERVVSKAATGDKEAINQVPKLLKGGDQPKADEDGDE
jgi:hypothetical protein